MSETILIQAVEADVDPPDARCRERFSLGFELRSVGGERDLLEALFAQGRDRPHQLLDIPPDEGLAAGKADPPDAARNEYRGEL